MMKCHLLQDSWCFGPSGSGSCWYGLGLFKDQFGQDVWPLANLSADPEDVSVIGHPGEDW